VIDMIAFMRRHAEQLLDLQRSVRALVVISSASVYRDQRSGQ
jgi:hypothetical protein